MRYVALGFIGALSACSTTLDPNYALQLQTYREAEQARGATARARADAEAARYNALAAIAERADPQTRGMAILAIALAGGRGDAVQEFVQQIPRAPETDMDRAYKWTSLFLGPAANLAIGYFGYRMGVTQSNNQTAQSIASTDSFASIAQAGFGTAQGIATAGFGAAQGIATAGFQNVQAPQPNVTLNGQGAISTGLGSSSFTYRDCRNTGSPSSVGGSAEVPAAPSFVLGIATNC